MQVYIYKCIYIFTYTRHDQAIPLALSAFEPPKRMIDMPCYATQASKIFPGSEMPGGEPEATPAGTQIFPPLASYPDHANR